MIDGENKKKTAGETLTVIIYACLAFSLPYELIARLFGGSNVAVYLSGAVLKALFCVYPIYKIRALGFREEFKIKRGFLKGLLLSLPALIVSLNNLPILPLITDDLVLNIYKAEIFPYILFCLAIGFSEELIFRGLLLPLFVGVFGRGKIGVLKAVTFSSALFALMHLLNLFGGAPLAVLTQVGYSFLIGLAFSLSALFTKNIFVPILLHSLFDFGGFLYDAFGEGVLWTRGNIILTAVVGAVSAVILTVEFIKTDFGEDFPIKND